MLLSEAIREYLAYRKSAGYSVQTVMTDGVALRRLLRVVGDKPLDKITHVMVDQVYAEMAERRLRSATVNLATAVMRTFFKWAMDRGYTKSSPATGRRYKRREARELARVPLAQFPALLDASRTPRDRMLIALGLFTMARKNEITGIRWRDVDLDSSELLIYISKTHQYDRMPISLELRREINRWVPVYEAECGPLQPDWYLVPAVYGGRRERKGWPLQPLRPMTNPEDSVAWAMDKIGITGEHARMHCLRRSAARARFDELTAKGYDGALRQVSAWLHHHSTAMTEHYLGLDLDRAQRDEETKDQALFPSLSDPNVIDLRSADGQDNAVGM